ncbi:hypothetical protein M413DRAFT_28441 [Hebeloma cylindrosporum]|uniref:Uncharacterized protein n=1 Tax=Hebeloma cylindrosporum TaxID=76867 RepID=A0A0C3CAP3_HEBCY|nr:hypothetical protein M413DRAFT_28441 [Hebeloma cylindrosporum h7]
MSTQFEDPRNEQDVAAQFVAEFYEDSEDQSSTGDPEAEDLFDLYNHSRALTPASIKGEEESDEVVSELDESHETNKMSAENQARLSTSTVKGAVMAIEEEVASREPNYLSKASQESSQDEFSKEKPPSNGE